MRIDRNFIIFSENEEWYTFEVGVGYVPTEKAPKEAVEAMEKYNGYAFKEK